MAWFSLWKWFITWRKIPYTNYINWYKRYLYDEWFNSLSEDKQKAELKRQQNIKEERKRDGKIALARFGMMFNVMNEITHGRMGDYMESARFVNRISLHQSKYW